MSHFTQDFRNHKDFRINLQVASISYEQTNSDFSAQLLESEHIKSMNPMFNRHLRKTKRLFQFKISETPAGYQKVSIERIAAKPSASAFGLFRSPRQARKTLERLADEHYLCHRLLGLEGSQKHCNERPCFRAQLRKCFGACQNLEPTSIYNDRLRVAMTQYQIKVWPWPSAILIEEGAASDVKAPEFHLVNNWSYLAKPRNSLELQELGYQKNESTAIAIADSGPRPESEVKPTDIDTYHILVKFLLDPTRMRLNKLRIWPLETISEPVS